MKSRQVPKDRAGEGHPMVSDSPPSQPCDRVLVELVVPEPLQMHVLALCRAHGWVWNLAQILGVFF